VLIPTIILIGWEMVSLMQQIKKTSHQKAEAEITRLKAELAEAKKD
jgi:hypothetical protein